MPKDEDVDYEFYWNKGARLQSTGINVSHHVALLLFPLDYSSKGAVGQKYNQIAICARQVKFVVCICFCCCCYALFPSQWTGLNGF